jgi:hypothetical protein
MAAPSLDILHIVLFLFGDRAYYSSFLTTTFLPETFARAG